MGFLQTEYHFLITDPRQLFFFIGTTSCLEENTDLYGNDIEPVTQRVTNSWQECGNHLKKNWMPFTKLWITNTFLVIVMLIYYEFTFLDALCNQYTQCRYWTWRGPYSLQCWLKTSDAGRYQDNGVFSGPKGCFSSKWSHKDSGI